MHEKKKSMKNQSLRTNTPARIGAGLWAATAFLLAAHQLAPEAAAQANRQTRLGVDYNVFQLRWTKVTGDLESDATDVSLLGAGLIGLGLHSDFALTSKLYLGGRFSFEYERVDVPLFDSDLNTLRLTVLPSLKVALRRLASRRLLPFVGGSMGLIYEGQFTDDINVNQTFFAFGPEFGAFYHVTPRFSFDPSISFLYRVGSTAVSDAVDLDDFSHGLVLMLTVGLSYWPR